MITTSLSASFSVVPQKGEDSFALHMREGGGAICVADGCGGLGSRRYARLRGATGAYLASRLVTRAFMQYADEAPPFPFQKSDARRFCAELGDGLHELLSRFEQKNRDAEANGEAATDKQAASAHIVGSMQRNLPTTLCAAVMNMAATGAEASPCLDACFLWAGDSRGYTLDPDGLRQLTRDDVRGEPDALCSLYRDAPLTNLLCADQPARLNARRVRLTSPCLAICATDGVFGCLQTPMEFEMLLLSTMNAASGMDNWRHKLEIAFSRLATDDATLCCAAFGFESFAQMNRAFAARRDLLRRRFIDPVRASDNGMDVAREKWSEYRARYDWTEGSDDETDWRV